MDIKFKLFLVCLHHTCVHFIKAYDSPGTSLGATAQKVLELIVLEHKVPVLIARKKRRTFLQQISEYHFVLLLVTLHQSAQPVLVDGLLANFAHHTFLTFVVFVASDVLGLSDLHLNYVVSGGVLGFFETTSLGLGQFHHHHFVFVDQGIVYLIFELTDGPIFLFVELLLARRVDIGDRLEKGFVFQDFVVIVQGVFLLSFFVFQGVFFFEGRGTSYVSFVEVEFILVLFCFHYV